MGRDEAAGGTRLVDALAGPGFGVEPEFVTADLVRVLAAGIAQRRASGDFRAAAVGAGARRAVRPEIRGDEIAWLLRPESDAELEVLARLDRLRERLNRELTLGLEDFECHYAIYPAGAGYVRHLDRSPGGAERVVSAVLYLNERWQPGDGGELVIFAEDGATVVPPRAGTLVLFLSERLEHEVRTARRMRLSLTGWFRRRPLGGVVR